MSETGYQPLGDEVALYTTDGMDRGEWLRRRHEGRTIGASAVAAVLGWSPWQSPRTVWERLVATEPPAADKAFPLDAGTGLEPRILSDLVALTGWQVETHPWVLRHATVECLTCNLDAVVQHRGAPAVAELKWSGWRNRQKWEHLRDHRDWDALRGTSLYQYYWQVQAQLAVTGLEMGYLYGIVGEEAGLRLVYGYEPAARDRFLIEIPRHDESIDYLEEQVEAFYWHHVMPGEVGPPPAERPFDLDAIRESLREELEGVRQVRDDLGELHASVLALKDAKAEAEKAAKAARDAYETERARLAEQLGAWGAFEINGRKVTHRETARGPRITGA